MSDRDGVETRFVVALLELSESKPLKKITVKDVLTAAGTARQTFYNHFYDINDLISYIPISVFGRNYPPFCSRDMTEAAFLYAINHKGFFSQLAEHQGQNCFRDSYIRQLKQSYYQATLGGLSDEEERLRRKTLVDVYLYGIVDLFLDWCHDGMTWSHGALVEAIFGAKPDFVPIDMPSDHHTLP